MKIAIVGSRSITADIPEKCIPDNTTEIFSGGAKGIDTSARNYAKKHHIQILEILPEYDLYGRSAPLRRNDWILTLSDIVSIVWDGKSHGANYMLKNCRKLNKPMKLFEFVDGRFVLTEEILFSEAESPDFLKNFVPTIIYE